MTPVNAEPVEPESSQVPITRLDSLVAIEARLFVVTEEARRMTVVDHLGRPNPGWAAQHRRINYLLDAWQRRAKEEASNG